MSDQELTEEQLAEREAAGIPRDAEVRPGLYVAEDQPVDTTATEQLRRAFARWRPMLQAQLPEAVELDGGVPELVHVHLDVATDDDVVARVEGQLPPAVLAATLRELADQLDGLPELVDDGRPSTWEAGLRLLATWDAVAGSTDGHAVRALAPAVEQLRAALA